MNNLVHSKRMIILFALVSLVTGEPFLDFLLQDLTADDDPCAPGCSNHGVCWEEMEKCNCTSLYRGDHCESLAPPIKCLILVLIVLILVILIYCFCKMNNSPEHRKVPTLPVADPFISSLDRIRESESVKQMWMGDKFQSRDSYLTSNPRRKERWWKPKQKYSSVSVIESFCVCNKQIK